MSIFELLTHEGIEEHTAKSLEGFAALLTEANSRFNLTRITGEEDMARLHFLDSLAPVRLGLLKKGESIIDVGTGAGLPAIPLAAAGFAVTAVEASAKKLNFVKETSCALGLPVSCICGRAEELAAGELKARFDVCVSRALASMSMLLELCSPFIRVGGRLICYKGSSAVEEAAAAGRAAEILGLSAPKLISCGIDGLEHKLAVYTRVSPLPAGYPRKFARIKSAPL